MQIFGAGMAGLLAANMLRRHQPTIFEAVDSLPNNHAALLRFRTDAVSRVTGIPFKKVRVRKAIHYKGELLDKASLNHSNMYSQKVTGKVSDRSILNLEPADRYIAPPDFIQQMANSCRINYNCPLNSLVLEDVDGPIISTIPMPTLMDIVNWPNKPLFPFVSIASATCELLDVDVYQTIYYPEVGKRQYRASLTGNQLIIEFVIDCGEDEDYVKSELEQTIRETCWHFGINSHRILANSTKMKFQHYGKIAPIDDAERKEFIIAMSDQYQLYSIGRFATWRQLLMDDVVQDVHIVEQFITERNRYQKRMAMRQGG